MKNPVSPFQSVFHGILQGLEWVVFWVALVGFAFGFSPVFNSISPVSFSVSVDFGGFSGFYSYKKVRA
jgi:hypothetical protein